MKMLKELRVKCKLTQVQLSRIMGVSQSVVAMWELGKMMPSADKLPKLADTLNCTIDALYGRESPQTREAAS